MKNINFAVPNQKKALQNSRKSLPQITRADSTDFIQFLKNRKAPPTINAMLVSKLIPSQKEFDFEKVGGLMKKSQEELSQPIFVSKDNYILDGHHRVLALFNKNPNAVIRVNKVPLYIQDLISFAHQYEKSFTKELTETKQVTSFLKFLSKN